MEHIATLGYLFDEYESGRSGKIYYNGSENTLTINSTECDVNDGNRKFIENRLESLSKQFYINENRWFVWYASKTKNGSVRTFEKKSMWDAELSEIIACLIGSSL